MNDTPPTPLNEPARTSLRDRRQRKRLSEQLRSELVGDLPHEEIGFWERASRIVAPRSWMASARANVLTFLVTVAFVYTVWCVWDLFLGRNPSDIRSIGVVNHDVVKGQELLVDFDIMRYRTCERDFEWSMQDANGKREWFRDPHLHAVGLVGPDRFRRGLQVPGTLAAGPAHLRMIWSWQCPENVYEQISSKTLVLPDMKFNIVDPPRP